MKKTLTFIVLFVLAAIVGWYIFRNMAIEKRTLIGIARWVINEEYDRNIAAFKESLTRAGFIEGKDIEYIIRNPELDSEKQREIVKEFIDKKVDLIYSLTTPGTLIIKEMVKDIPIVFSIVTYPVEADVIKALDNSGNNLVGTRNYIPMEVQFRTFQTIYQGVKAIGFVHREGEPNSTIQYHELKEFVRDMGIEVISIAPARVVDLKEALEAVQGINALYSACDTLVQGGGEEIVIEFARKNKLPDFSCNKSGVKKGSLIGNIADFAVIGGMAGEKAAKILKGVNPQSLRTKSPEKEYIMINMDRAKELGIELSAEFIMRASEIID